MSDESHALVPAPQPAAPPPVERHGDFTWDPTREGRPMWCNVNLDTVHGRRAIMAMRCKADLTAEQVIGQLVHVVHAMVSEVHLTRQDGGEIVSLPRTVLQLQDGRTLAFVSMGAYESLRFILAIYGQGPWDGGLPVRVKQVRTRSGFRTYELTVEEPDPADVQPREKGGRRG